LKAELPASSEVKAKLEAVCFADSFGESNDPAYNTYIAIFETVLKTSPSTPLHSPTHKTHIT
jgi:hypothetical protein